MNKPILQRANELIGGERQKDYGAKLQNFSQIAMLWQGTLAAKLLPDARITPEDVALLMIQVKIARLAKMPDHEDSVLDIAGYAGCYEALQLERENDWPLLGATKDARAKPPRVASQGLAMTEKRPDNWNYPSAEKQFDRTTTEQQTKV